MAKNLRKFHELECFAKSGGAKRAAPALLIDHGNPFFFIALNERPLQAELKNMFCFGGRRSESNFMSDFLLGVV